MEEDIKILEEMITWDCLLPNKRQTEALENLIKGYRELKEITNTYDAFANDYIPNDVKIVIADRRFFQDGIFNESFIPKSKIKEKIKECKNAGVTKTLNNENEVIEEYYFLQDEIDILQELLGDEE